MTAFLRRLPVPAGCLALGLIGLGTLLESISPFFLLAFGILSVLLQIAVLLKLFLPGTLSSVFSDTAALSPLAGTSMALMLTAAQLKKALSFPGALWLWYFGLCLHLLIILRFSFLLFYKRAGLSAVRGSWLLVYVGIAAAAISAPAFGREKIGLFLLLPAAIGAGILLPLIYRADLQPGNVPPGQKPLFCITAAPVSIWLVGFLSVYGSPSGLFVLVLLCFAQVLYVPALIRCLRCLRSLFSPAFASFTFPFVISASALKQASAFLQGPFWTGALLTAECIIALLLCLYVLLLYLRHVFGTAAS